MDMTQFEDRLLDLISEAQSAGLSRDEIISVLEMRKMALEEEEG
jgi:hypothetical protein